MSSQQVNWTMIGVIITLALQTVGFVWFMSALNSKVLFLADIQKDAVVEQKVLAKRSQIHDMELALLKQKLAIINYNLE